MKRKAVEPGSNAAVAGKAGKAGKAKLAENPFERRVVRSKHKVVNRPQTHLQQTAVGESRSAAENSRKTTLLVDLHKRQKANDFDDRRFGEKEGLSQEDKMLARFQRERMAKFRKQSKFILSDNEGFTHRGLPLDLETTNFVQVRRPHHAR